MYTTNIDVPDPVAPNMKTILLTGSIHPDAAALLARHARVVVAPDPSPASLKAGIVEADAVVVRHYLPTGIFQDALRLRCAVRHGTGLDLIPVDEATQRGILVANVPGVNAEFVAEHAIGQIINLSRRLPCISNAFRRHSWELGKDIALGGAGLKGKTVGIVGFGAIGQALAHMCHAGFGMKVIAAKRPGQDYGNESAIARQDMRELLRVSDFVVLCCPLTEETKGLIDTAALSRMKRSAYLINVARGPIINTHDLIKALEQDRIAGAALDVYEDTPLPQNSSLFGIHNLIMTPHTAAMTADSMRIMGMESASQIIEVLQGNYPAHWVNRKAEESIASRWKHLDAQQ